MINRVGSEEYFLILDQHHWATLVWPLMVVESAEPVPGRWNWQYCLNPDAAVDWLFVFEPGYYEVQPTKVAWSEWYGLALSQVGDAQPLIKYVLLEKVKEFTNKALQVIAGCLGLEKPDKKTRKELLSFLAGQQGNDAYVEEVLERDQNGKNPGKQKPDQEYADFLNLLFGELDKDELQDFRELRPQQEVDDLQKKKKQWRAWLKEKVEENKALN